MRWLTAVCAALVAMTLAGRADAVGRMPGNTLQFLGWGYGEGYHAPIVHAHPPVQRGILHAPGGHWIGGSLFGYSSIHPHTYGCCPNCRPHGHGPVHTAPYPFGLIPEPIELLPETLPPAPQMDGGPRTNAPPAPSAEGESLPVPEASLPRAIRRG